MRQNSRKKREVRVQRHLHSGVNGKGWAHQQASRRREGRTKHKKGSAGHIYARPSKEK